MKASFWVLLEIIVLGVLIVQSMVLNFFLFLCITYIVFYQYSLLLCGCKF